MSEIEEFNLENSIGLEIKRRKEEEDAAVWIMLQEEESDIRLEKRGLKSMAWRQRYDWLEEGKLADILARLEIGACIVDNPMDVVEECETMEQELLEDKEMDMKGGITEDAISMVIIQEDHQETGEKDECIISIHCPGGCTMEKEPTAGGCKESRVPGGNIMLEHTLDKWKRNLDK